MEAKTIIGFLALVVGMFMAILDIQIVASSLAEIQAGVSASQEEISWVQTSYLIAEVIVIPISGWLAHVFSTRLLFSAACFGFTIASVLCSLAWNLESLIVFRVLQGLLGGMMIPTVFAASYTLFPRDKQAGITVIIGLVATMAPAIGPTVGGYITDSFGWHWLFLINVLPGMVVTILVFYFVNIDEPDLSRLKGFDLIGILLIALFLGCMEFVLEEGPGEDWFNSTEITFFAIIMTISGILMFWRELTIENPVVNLRAFNDENFAIGSFYSFIVGIGLYGSVYLMPLFLASVRGYNAVEIGKVVMVTGIFQFLSAPIAGALSKKIDLRLMLTIGLFLFGMGLYLNTGLNADWSFWEFFIPQMIRGLSLMMIFVPINTLALGTLPVHELKNASGLYNLMRNLGGAVGLAVINTLLTNQRDLHSTHLSEQINYGRQQVIDMLGQIQTTLTPQYGDHAYQATLELVRTIVGREAAVMAFADVFMATAAIFFISMLLMPFVKKVAIKKDEAAEHTPSEV
ncbi:MAG: DHA2 family efflux MFS transporter permease subunit [Terasakiella sp.]|uniref:DHA2 family efflux MFS transporter permease subunit n=1 Tax=unclassified Terasakiella TaxID=2614952 RepID=UPI003B00F626